MANNLIYKKIDALFEDTSMPSIVLLDGKWGSGKSYYVKNHLKPLLEKDFKEPLVFFSLYGISSIEDFRDKLISAYYFKDTDSTSRFNKLIESLVGASKMNSNQTSGALSSIYGGLKGIGKHSILSKLDNIILILDDLERISKNEVRETILGECLELAEEKNIKIIVVANSSTITETSAILDKTFIDKVGFSISPSEMVDIAFSDFELSENNKSIILDAIQTLNLNNLRVLKRSANKLKSLINQVKLNEDVDWDLLFNSLIPQVISLCYVHYEKGITCKKIKLYIKELSLYFLYTDEEKKENVSEEEESIYKLLSLGMNATEDTIDYSCGEKLDISEAFDYGFLPMKSQPLDRVIRGGIRYVTESDFQQVYTEMIKYITNTDRPELNKWFIESVNNFV